MHVMKQKLGLKDIKYLCHGYNFQHLAKLAECNIPIADKRTCDTSNGKMKDRNLTRVSLGRAELSGSSYCASSQFSFSLHECITDSPMVKKGPGA